MDNTSYESLQQQRAATERYQAETLSARERANLEHKLIEQDQKNLHELHTGYQWCGVILIAVMALVCLGWHGCNTALREACIHEHNKPAECAKLP